MKHLFSVLAVAGIISITFLSCKKDGLSNVSVATQIKEHQDSTAAILTSGLGTQTWRISSITVSPAQNGQTAVAIDPCDSAVTYNFGALTMGSGTEGYVSIHYNNSPCNGFKRPASSERSNVPYGLDSNPNVMDFPDSALGTDNYYTIIKTTAKILVLQIVVGNSTFTRTYLPVN